MKDRISAMVDRFLGWKLPKTFGPDCGIKFTPANGMTREEAYDKVGWWPIGTNLLTATEAREMLEHVTAVDVPELSLQELDALGRAYFNGPLNANEEMFGRAVERAVRRRLLGTPGVKATPAPRWRNLDEAMRDPLFHACRGIMGTSRYGEDDSLFRALMHFASGVALGDGSKS